MLVSSASHHMYEFLVVDLSVAVNVHLSDDLVDFVVAELLPHVGHEVAELVRRYEPVAVAVEHAERLADHVGIVLLKRPLD